MDTIDSKFIRKLGIVRVIKIVGPVLLFLTLMGLGFVIGFEEGYNQAIEDLQDVLKVSTSCTTAI